ncbi:unnamed protein product [Dovyalis caffra]|uniref:Uncharacterized protein n=1 Tax=Dovyalis caffra TaxID=77055 RepID=A0AAV1STU5_9ROSI|nr:unnamed protein product [Dovyalis caffra]
MKSQTFLLQEGPKIMERSLTCFALFKAQTIYLHTLTNMLAPKESVLFLLQVDGGLDKRMDPIDDYWTRKHRPGYKIQTQYNTNT